MNKPSPKVPKANTKRCSTCQLDKSANEFRRDGSKRDGLRYSCGECENRQRRSRRLKRREQENVNRREYYRRNKARIIQLVKKSYQKRRSKVLLQKTKYRASNRDVIRERKKADYWLKRDAKMAKMRDYAAKNRERLNAAKREVRKANPEKDRAINKRFRLRHPERIAKVQRDYYMQNKPRLIAWARQYRNSTPDRKMRVLLRHRLRDALKHNRRIASTISLLGCSIEFFKSYFERLFTEGMSWERFMKKEIHIDHIRPCSSFDLSIPEQQKACFHYSNLQPLWARENLRKGSKWVKP